MDAFLRPFTTVTAEKEYQFVPDDPAGDPCTGLSSTGAYESRSDNPWRDYTAAVVVAKEAADRRAVAYAHWPLIAVTVRKRKSGQPGVSTVASWSRKASPSCWKRK